MSEEVKFMPQGLGDGAISVEVDNPHAPSPEAAQDAADYMALKLLREFGKEIDLYPLDTSATPWRVGWFISVQPECNTALLRGQALTLQEQIYMSHRILVPFKIGVVTVE